MNTIPIRYLGEGKYMGDIKPVVDRTTWNGVDNLLLVGAGLQQYIPDSKMAYTPGGAASFYKLPVGHSVPIIAAGVSDYGLQGGAASGKPNTPLIVDQYGMDLISGNDVLFKGTPWANMTSTERIALAKKVQKNPSEFSSVGSDLYGWGGIPLDDRTYQTEFLKGNIYFSSGGKNAAGDVTAPNNLPAATWNYAGLPGLLSTNTPKSRTQTSNLPNSADFVSDAAISMALPPTVTMPTSTITSSDGKTQYTMSTGVPITKYNFKDIAPDFFQTREADAAKKAALPFEPAAEPEHIRVRGADIVTTIFPAKYYNVDPVTGEHTLKVYSKHTPEMAADFKRIAESNIQVWTGPGSMTEIDNPKWIKPGTTAAPKPTAGTGTTTTSPVVSPVAAGIPGVTFGTAPAGLPSTMKVLDTHATKPPTPLLGNSIPDIRGKGFGIPASGTRTPTTTDTPTAVIPTPGSEKTTFDTAGSLGKFFIRTPVIGTTSAATGGNRVTTAYAPTAFSLDGGSPDPIMKFISDTEFAVRPYTPLITSGLLLGSIQAAGNVKNRDDLVKNKDTSFAGAVNYYQEFGTRYSQNEVMIWGDANTGGLLGVTEGEYGSVSSIRPNVPQGVLSVNAHVHPEIIFGTNALGLYNPAFSKGDTDIFQTWNKEGVVETSIITKKGILTTSPSLNAAPSIEYRPVPMAGSYGYSPLIPNVTENQMEIFSNAGLNPRLQTTYSRNVQPTTQPIDTFNIALDASGAIKKPLVSTPIKEQTVTPILAPSSTTVTTAQITGAPKFTLTNEFDLVGRGLPADYGLLAGAGFATPVTSQTPKSTANHFFATDTPTVTVSGGNETILALGGWLDTNKAKLDAYAGKVDRTNPAAVAAYNADIATYNQKADTYEAMQKQNPIITTTATPGFYIAPLGGEFKPYALGSKQGAPIPKKNALDTTLDWLGGNVRSIGAVPIIGNVIDLTNQGTSYLDSVTKAPVASVAMGLLTGELTTLAARPGAQPEKASYANMGKTYEYGEYSRWGEGLGKGIQQVTGTTPGMYDTQISYYENKINTPEKPTDTALDKYLIPSAMIAGSEMWKVFETNPEGVLTAGEQMVVAAPLFGGANTAVTGGTGFVATKLGFAPAAVTRIVGGSQYVLPAIFTTAIMGEITKGEGGGWFTETKPVNIVKNVGTTTPYLGAMAIGGWVGGGAGRGARTPTDTGSPVEATRGSGKSPRTPDYDPGYEIGQNVAEELEVILKPQSSWETQMKNIEIDNAIRTYAEPKTNPLKLTYEQRLNKDFVSVAKYDAPTMNEPIVIEMRAQSNINNQISDFFNDYGGRTYEATQPKSTTSMKNIEIDNAIRNFAQPSEPRLSFEDMVSSKFGAAAKYEAQTINDPFVIEMRRIDNVAGQTSGQFFENYINSEGYSSRVMSGVDTGLPAKTAARVFDAQLKSAASKYIQPSEPSIMQNKFLDMQSNLVKSASVGRIYSGANMIPRAAFEGVTTPEGGMRLKSVETHEPQKTTISLDQIMDNGLDIFGNKKPPARLPGEDMFTWAERTGFESELDIAKTARLTAQGRKTTGNKWGDVSLEVGVEGAKSHVVVAPEVTERITASQLKRAHGANKQLEQYYGGFEKYSSATDPLMVGVDAFTKYSYQARIGMPQVTRSSQPLAPLRQMQSLTKGQRFELSALQTPSEVVQETTKTKTKPIMVNIERERTSDQSINQQDDMQKELQLSLSTTLTSARERMSEGIATILKQKTVTRSPEVSISREKSVSPEKSISPEKYFEKLKNLEITKVVEKYKTREPEKIREPEKYKTPPMLVLPSLPQGGGFMGAHQTRTKSHTQLLGWVKKPVTPAKGRSRSIDLEMARIIKPSRRREWVAEGTPKAAHKPTTRRKK
jgi:hypothetical protein